MKQLYSFVFYFFLILFCQTTVYAAFPPDHVAIAYKELLSIAKKSSSKSLRGQEKKQAWNKFRKIYNSEDAVPDERSLMIDPSYAENRNNFITDLYCFYKFLFQNDDISIISENSSIFPFWDSCLKYTSQSQEIIEEDRAFCLPSLRCIFSFSPNKEHHEDQNNLRAVFAENRRILDDLVAKFPEIPYLEEILLGFQKKLLGSILNVKGKVKTQETSKNLLSNSLSDSSCDIYRPISEQSFRPDWSLR